MKKMLITITDEQNMAVRAAAKAGEMSLSEFIRRLIDGSVRTVTLVPSAKPEKRKHIRC